MPRHYSADDCEQDEAKGREQEGRRMSYTPGPWTFRGMFEPTGDKITYQVIGGVIKADAVLMSAAPELLAALKAILDSDHWKISKVNDPEYLQACVAVAKAEGRT